MSYQRRISPEGAIINCGWLLILFIIVNDIAAFSFHTICIVNSLCILHNWPLNEIYEPTVSGCTLRGEMSKLGGI